MKKLLLLLVLLTLSAAIAHAITISKDIAITVTSVTPTGGNEVFVGPFANWLNVRTTAGCGATGNGSTDDTTAIQNCINMLGNTIPVLYFPAGTYKITAPLTLSTGSSVSLIGATPAPTCAGGVAEAGTVCIVWGGVANSAVMLRLTSVSYSAVDRIAFNGMGGVASLIADNAGGGFNTGNEYTDDVFVGAGGTYNGSTTIDFACGWDTTTTPFSNGGGCAEISFTRNHFIGGTLGIDGGNFNSGDMWVWYSTFTNTGIALSNDRGDIQAFNNNFSASSTADILINPQAEQNFDWNYSSGSNQFISCNSDTGNANATMAEGNTIVNTTLRAINCNGNAGPLIFIDNVVYSKAGATTPVISTATTPNDLLTTGNTFSTIAGGVLNTCGSSSDYVQGSGRCHSVGDQTTSSDPPSAPALPGTPPQYCVSDCPNTVSVQEVSSAGAIQGAICTASNGPSSTFSSGACTGNPVNLGNVVHIQAGTYSPSATLVVPGNSFVQIIGDGMKDDTVLVAGLNPIISCGPTCKARIRNLELSGSSAVSPDAVGIKLTGSDISGGRIYSTQIAGNSNVNAFLVNGLLHTNVELHNEEVGLNGYFASSGAAGINANIVGSGSPSSSFTNVFASSTGCNTGADWQVSGHGNLTVRHSWHDAGSNGSTCINAGTKVANVTGSGSFSILGAREYLWGCTRPTPCTSTNGNYFNLTNFSGVSAILGIATAEGDQPANISITGTGGASNLSEGFNSCNTVTNSQFSDTGTGDAYYSLNPQVSAFDGTHTPGCENQVAGGISGSSAQLSEVSANVSSLAAFLTTTLAPLRSALPTVPGAAGDPAVAPGVTDARLYRIFGQRSIHVIDVEP